MKKKISPKYLYIHKLEIDFSTPFYFKAELYRENALSFDCGESGWSTSHSSQLHALFTCPDNSYTGNTGIIMWN
jgi:hypothetical protein